MIAVTFSPVLAGLSLGIALASAPGPVQAVLMAEAVRGGVGRGFRALAGSSLTFGVLLVALALGLSVAPPGGIGLRILKVGGGALLVWLAVDGLRARTEPDPASAGRRTLPPAMRGMLAILLNPGAWIFLATVASALLATATRGGGRVGALVTALALLVGAAVGDAAVVLIGGLGLRRAGERIGSWVRRALAVVLAGVGVWLVVSGVMS